MIDSQTMLGTNVWLGHFVCIGCSGEGPAAKFGDNAVIRSHSVIYRGVAVGHDFACGHHVTIRSGTVIGNGVSIGTGCVLEHDVVVRDGARLHSQCFVPELSVIEEGAWLGPGVTLTNARYPNRSDTKQNLQGVHVGQAAVLGARVTVLPGVRIGEGAMVGAGSVVVRDVEAGATLVGNPARPSRVAE